VDIDSVTALLVAGGTVFGGIALRYVDHWLTKRKSTLDEGAAWRKELRDEVTAQKNEIEELEKQLDHWKVLYYDLREQYGLLKVQLEEAMSRIRREATRAEKMLPDPNKLPPPDTS
jgi:chromosome segregation ATPase